MGEAGRGWGHETRMSKSDFAPASSASERKPGDCSIRCRTGDYHFRKQEQIGPFYVDFVCHHANLIIEVDGESHYAEGAQERDAMRDAFLAGEGYTMLRGSPTTRLARTPTVCCASLLTR